MKTPASRFILTGVLAIVVFASSSFTLLQSSLPNQLSAFATFPGENGKSLLVASETATMRSTL